MINENIKVISHLLGCYFHQDWPDEFDSDHSALQAIVSGESNEQLQKGVKEIDLILTANLSEDELRDILVNDVGCYFEPMSRGITYQAWLMEVRNNFTGNSGLF